MLRRRYPFPQILLLSGIGPKETLEKLGIETKVDLPEVCQHLTDHLAMYQFFKLKDPSQGYALRSANPLFSRPEYGARMPCDILAWTDLPREGLIETITKDEGAAPDPKTHPLLRQPRAHLEPAIVFMAMSQDPPINLDGTHIWSILIPFLPTSRRSVSINKIDPATYPVIDLNWLATEVDRYACRAAIRQNTRLMLNSSFGCGIIEGETPPAGIRPVSLDDDDEYLDMRARQSAVTVHHPHGTCAMGKVVDTELRVKVSRVCVLLTLLCSPLHLGRISRRRCMLWRNRLLISLQGAPKFAHI